jgi:hypothetical protein
MFSVNLLSSLPHIRLPFVFPKSRFLIREPKLISRIQPFGFRVWLMPGPGTVVFPSANPLRLPRRLQLLAMTEEERLVAQAIRFGTLPWTSPPFLFSHECHSNVILSSPDSSGQRRISAIPRLAQNDRQISTNDIQLLTFGSILGPKHTKTPPASRVSNTLKLLCLFCQ